MKDYRERPNYKNYREWEKLILNEFRRREKSGESMNTFEIIGGRVMTLSQWLNEHARRNLARRNGRYYGKC